MFIQTQQQDADEVDEKGSVIIAGHGRFGGIINRMLLGAGLNFPVSSFFFLEVVNYCSCLGAPLKGRAHRNRGQIQPDALLCYRHPNKEGPMFSGVSCCFGVK